MMNSILIRISTAAGLLLSLSVPAAELPDAFRAIYNVTMGPVTIGESQRVLSKSDRGEYLFEAYSSTKGVASLFVKDKLRERSRWVFANDQIRPIEYRYERTGGKKEREINLRFNWAKNIVTNTVNADPWQMTVPNGTQDKLVYQLSVMRDLARGKTEFRYQVADGGRLKEYQAKVVGYETLKTPMGQLETVKVKRVDDKRGTTLWCAKSLYYIPVQIEQTETDGDFFKATIKSVDGIVVPQPGAPAAGKAR